MASIEKRGGSWRVVWRLNGRKQGTSWPSEADAQQARDIVEAHRHGLSDTELYAAMGVEVAEEAPSAPVGPTLRSWCEEWLPSKTRITPGVRATYRRQLEAHIYPHLGDVLLRDLTSVMVGTWLNALRQVPAIRSPKTVTRYYSVLHSALDAAVTAGHIDRNPCRGTDFVRDQTADDDQGDHHGPVYLSPAEYELFRSHFDACWHELLDTLVETGVRWSEGTALAAQHLVTPTASSGPKLRVWRAWKRSGKGSGRYLGTTKGRQRRTLPIGHELYERLAKLVDGDPPTTFLFRDDDKAVEYDGFYDQVWKPALRSARRCAEHPPLGEGRQVPGAAGRCGDHGGQTGDGRPCGARVAIGTTRCPRHYGVPLHAVSTCDCLSILHRALSPHDLRHTCASWLLSDPRMTILAVSRILGHADPSTTTRHYGGLRQEAELLAVDAIRDARASAKEPPATIQ